MKRIGGVWKHEKEGKKYLTGTIETTIGLKIRIGIFSNKEKKTKNAPDYLVYYLDDETNKKPVTIKQDPKIEMEDVL